MRCEVPEDAFIAVFKIISKVFKLEHLGRQIDNKDDVGYTTPVRNSYTRETLCMTRGGGCSYESYRYGGKA